MARKARIVNRRVKIGSALEGRGIYLDGVKVGWIEHCRGDYRSTYVYFAKDASAPQGYSNGEAVCRTYSVADASRWVRGVLKRFSTEQVADRCGFSVHYQTRVSPGDVFRLATGLGIGE